jgi:malonyl-CoA O-methyltransferase
MIDKRAVARHFSRAAATYDEAALVQADMARDLAVLCPALPAAPRLLEIGCGTGLFTDQLLALYPDASLTIVDISPAMTDHCREKYRTQSRVQVVEATAKHSRMTGSTT